jgi:RNA polymerase sigma factor (sigma-70 family)
MDERQLLQIHLREVRRFTPPTREEERELARKAQAGDIEARNELVERHARLVGEILDLHYVDLSSYFSPGAPVLPVSLMDLVQEGYLGLIAACEQFDLDCGWRFTTYAGAWIRKHISEALSPPVTGVGLPDRARRKSRKLLGAGERMMQELGREPTLAEIAERCNVTEERALDLLGAVQMPEYLDAPADPSCPFSPPLVETLFNDDAPAPDLQVQCREAVEIAEKYLPDRELEIVKRYFGIDGDAETSPEIAADLGLTRVRVWQLLTESLTMLRSLTKGD